MKRLAQPVPVFLLALAVLAAAAWLRLHQLPAVPFSWHPDEAAHGLEARDVLRGHWPIFFSQFTGHEALFIYLTAGAFTLFGDSIWSARLVPAVAGLLTVALTVPLGASLWPGGRGRRIGLWAALLLAVSIWHLIASRNGYRAILQPLLQVPAMLFLLRGLRSRPGRSNRAWAFFVLAGVFAGLNLHTYIASRAFPFVAAVVGLAGLALSAGRAAILKGLAFSTLAGLLVFAPLGVDFYQHPDHLLGRAADISIWTPKWTGGDAAGVLTRNLADTLAMFTQRGDPSFKHNIGGRPVFDQLIGALFWVGLAVTAARLFKRDERLASITLLAWLAIMLLPMLLSAQGLPHYLRAIGVLPALMIFPAIVLEWIWSAAGRWAQARSSRPWGQTAVLFAAVIPMAAWSVQAHRLFFRDWHAVPANDIERVVQAAYLDRDLSPMWDGEPVYLSSEYPEQVTLAYLNPQMYDALHGFDARQAVPLPPAGTATDYYVLLETEPGETLLARAGLKLTRIVEGRFGQPVYRVYHFDGRWPRPERTAPMGWSWEIAFPPGWSPTPIAAPVNFQDRLTLLGYDLSAEAAGPGEPLTLTLYWQLAGPADEVYSMFAHVLDAESQVVAEFDGNAYPSIRWHAGELLLSSFPMSVRSDAVSGVYQLEVGVYARATGERLFILEQGQPVADRLLLQPITIR